MTTPPIIAPKKLIEVALPLDAINKACAREKAIRHGHPSTLHLWWARRPLAATRAVLFAQLVNDPSWRYNAEELKKNQIKGAITKKRNELFKLITELVQWENTTNEQVLERARKEIRSSWRETCDANKSHPDAKKLFDPEKLPAFHDPFAGGGSIPLEAQRLGLETHASDLNPVAVLINKAMIEIPPKFAGRPPVGPVPKSEKQSKAKPTEDWSDARGLAEDVRRYGAWMREQAEKRLGYLYPKMKITKAMVNERPDLTAYEGKELTIIAWLWARTVKSPNPAFAHVNVPLISTQVLATKPGKEAYVEPVLSKTDYGFKVKIGRPKNFDELKRGTKLSRGANFRCLMSGTPITAEYIKSEGISNRMGARLMAVVAEGVRGRVYLSPTEEQESIAASARPTWVPEQEIAYDPHSGATYCVLYGLTKFKNLFTDRQLVSLAILVELTREARERAIVDATQAGWPDDTTMLAAGGNGAAAYGDAIAVYLALFLSRLVNLNNNLCQWRNDPAKEHIGHLFTRQAIPMIWDFAEANPLGESGGSFASTFDFVPKVILSLTGHAPGLVGQEDAARQLTSFNKVVSTDPPYYDNVPYADLSDFFYAWLRHSLRTVFPDLFTTLAAPKTEELVAAPNRHGSAKQAEDFFLAGMTGAMHRIAEQAHSGFPTTIYYAFKQSESKSSDGTSNTGWETFLKAVLDAELGLTGTWPMRTELANRMVGSETNALASSIVMVCRPRTGIAATVARKDFLRELDRALPLALAEMIADLEAAVAPVDLAQASIGPGMAIFSKYKAVLEADGSPMTVRNALVHINKAIDNYFAEAEGELDADTRFCIGWFQQYGFDAGPFGEADVLARAKGTAVDGMKDAGVIEASKGKVRLFKIKDLPKQWDPANDDRIPVWEACHQLCRALGENESEAGALLARMPERQDAIRQLAYRLYTICERKKWAEEARAYNELITSWSAIVEESHKVGHKGTQLGLI